MDSRNKPVRVSVAMLIDQLREDSANVAEARATLSKAIEARNASLYELKAAGVSEAALMRYTGLSRDSIKVITANARRTPEALDLETSRA